MKLIYEITQKLRNQEIREIRHKIRSSSFPYEKAGALFDLVTRYEQKEEAFYSQKLYNKPPDNTFRVTKSRLKRMLENILLNDKSVSGYKTQSVNIQLQSQKKLLQGQILLGRGAYESSKNLLQQVIARSKKFDLTDVQFQADLLLYRSNSIRTPVKDYQKQTEKLLDLNRLNSQVNECLILHYSISNLLLQRALKKNQLEEVRSKIDRMQQIAEETGHSQARMVYFRSEIYYHQVNSTYEQALEFATNYLDFLNTDKSQNNPTLIGGAWLQLSQIHLQLNQLPEARSCAEEALRIYNNQGMNSLIVLELCFRISFYANGYSEARQHIDTAFAHPQFNASATLAARWHYFYACLLFNQGEYRDAYRELNSTSPLLADKYGMNIHIRLLEIMIMHEMQNLDLLETKILNMRQYIKRSHKDSDLFRPMLLINILMIWHRQSYHFGKTLSKIKPKLVQLDSYHAANPFRTSDFELIRFENWMKNKSD